MPCSLRRRVAVEERDRLGDGCPGHDLARDGLLLGDHARELLDAPLVGLVEVDDGAEEVPRPQRVDVAADAVALARDRLELALEERGERAVGGCRAGGRALELAAQRLGQFVVAGLRVLGERGEEAVGLRDAVRLRRDLADLAHGGHDALGGTRAEGGDVAVDRAAARRRASWRCAPSRRASRWA